LESGLKSKSEKTRNIIKNFSNDSERHISRISRQLRDQIFKFDKSDGILLPKPNQNFRPIVKASVKNRIVQRSILDVLQEDSNIQKYFINDSSFGGIEDQGVPEAIRVTYETILNGAQYYIRSDIQEFFRNIPREIVLSKIKDEIDDPIFNDLLIKATDVELSNLNILGKYKHLFPIFDIGVAQGCCLSPLLGNILLNEFDIRMNDRGIRCLRYIDDFLILGKSRSKVFTAFKSAQEILKQLNLRAYDPLSDKAKSDFGYTANGLKFLGCEVLKGLIRPDRKSCFRLIEKVKNNFNNSLESMKTPIKCKLKDKRSFAETLSMVDNIVFGWGNQYYFCNDTQLLEHIDNKIDKLLREYIIDYNKLINSKYSTDNVNKRRLLGVHLLSDIKLKPIINKIIKD